MFNPLWYQPLRMTMIYQRKPASTGSKSMSPHVSLSRTLNRDQMVANSTKVGFYKSFGRPIAKVFLGAVFTYQVVYWLWVKLETDEIKQHQISTINLILFECPPR